LHHHSDTGDATPPRPGVPQALALALGAAVSLGLARFSYALLLPPMRDDLGWTYFTAGAMNTANAAGYLVGALLMPRWLARTDARWVMLAGMLAAALLLAVHGLAHGDVVLLLLRAATGIASAGTFVAGGLLAARLGQALAADPAHRHRGALVLGLYYGGTGAGIVASTLLVPTAAQWAAGVGAGGGAGLGWRAAWVALALAALAATALAARGTRVLAAPPPPVGGGARAPWSTLGWALAGYLCFGLGYIGYMTFVITLLRERG
jgi:MFS family permease